MTSFKYESRFSGGACYYIYYKENFFLIENNMHRWIVHNKTKNMQSKKG